MSPDEVPSPFQEIDLFKDYRNVKPTQSSSEDVREPVQMAVDNPDDEVFRKGVVRLKENEPRHDQWFCYLRILHFLLLLLSLGIKVFISASPRMQWYCRLSWKIVFWTHKFAVWLIDMGNNESQDP